MISRPMVAAVVLFFFFFFPVKTHRFVLIILVFLSFSQTNCASKAHIFCALNLKNGNGFFIFVFNSINNFLINIKFLVNLYVKIKN